jgi:hypothetical protein
VQATGVVFEAMSVRTPQVPVSAVLAVASRLRQIFMHWLTNYGFGSHLVDWLAVAVVVLVTIALRVGTRRFILWRLTHKRDLDKSEREYWRIHGG